MNNIIEILKLDKRNQLMSKINKINDILKKKVLNRKVFLVFYGSIASFRETPLVVERECYFESTIE